MQQSVIITTWGKRWDWYFFAGYVPVLLLSNKATHNPPTFELISDWLDWKLLTLITLSVMQWNQKPDRELIIDHHSDEQKPPQQRMDIYLFLFVCLFLVFGFTTSEATICPYYQEMYSVWKCERNISVPVGLLLFSLIKKYLIKCLQFQPTWLGLGKDCVLDSNTTTNTTGDISVFCCSKHCCKQSQRNSPRIRKYPLVSPLQMF